LQEVHQSTDVTNMAASPCLLKAQSHTPWNWFLRIASNGLFMHILTRHRFHVIYGCLFPANSSCMHTDTLMQQNLNFIQNVLCAYQFTSPRNITTQSKFILRTCRFTSPQLLPVQGPKYIHYTNFLEPAYRSTHLSLVSRSSPEQAPWMNGNDDVLCESSYEEVLITSLSILKTFIFSTFWRPSLFI
jgi:hypothetical protein